MTEAVDKNAAPPPATKPDTIVEPKAKAEPEKIAQPDAKAEAKAEAKVEPRFEVQVAKDSLKAFVKALDTEDPRPTTKNDILALLREADLAIDPAVEKRIAEFIAHVQGDEDKTEPFLIAEGSPAIDGADAEFIWEESLQKDGQDWAGDDAIDYYAFNAILTVEEDAKLGAIKQSVAGKVGRDVYGRALKPSRRPAEIKIGTGIRPSTEDPNILIAEVAGKATFKALEVRVDELVEIKGDVDYESGNIDSSTHVYIKGTVRDGFEVKSKKSIAVCGAVEAANMFAVENITIKGGILGRSKGAIESEGEIVAKFAEEASIKATGDVKIGKELMHSHVDTKGSLLAENGSIIGGTVYAREGIEVRALGSEAEIPTILTIGVHPDAIREAQALDKSIEGKRTTAQKVRQTLEPLVANIKRLSPQQKERVTELMYQADSSDSEVAELEAKRDKILAEAGPEKTPRVMLAKTLHPGVTLRIGRKQVVFKKELLGPVRIDERKVESATEFVAVNQLTGSITVLPSSHFEIEDVQDVEDKPAE